MNPDVPAAGVPPVPDPSSSNWWERQAHAVAEAGHDLIARLDPTITLVEYQAQQAIKQEIPAIEAEIVVFGNEYAPEFSAGEVAVLLTAVPQLSGFKDQLTAFATGINTRFLGALAAKYPPVPAAK